MNVSPRFLFDLIYWDVSRWRCTSEPSRYWFAFILRYANRRRIIQYLGADIIQFRPTTTTTHEGGCIDSGSATLMHFFDVCGGTLEWEATITSCCGSTLGIICCVTTFGCSATHAQQPKQRCLRATNNGHAHKHSVRVPVILIMGPSYGPHYASCPSVRLSVCLHVLLFVPYGLVTGKRKNEEKSRLAYTFSTARVSGVQIFNWKGQRSRSRDVKNLKNLA